MLTTITLDNGTDYPVPDLQRPKRALIGKFHLVVVPFSEAAMATGIAGHVHTVLLSSDRQAILYEDGRPRGSFIPSELGIRQDDRGFYFYPPMEASCTQ